MGELQARILDQLRNAPPPPEFRHDRGFVYCVGGLSLTSNAYLSLRRLRQFSRLPVEICHAGDEFPASLMPSWIEEFAPLTFTDLALQNWDTLGGMSTRSFRGYAIKPFALAFSSFRRAFLLDADNFPLKNPEHFFEAPGNAHFWPDTFDANFTQDALFEIFGLPASLNKSHPEFETGQILAHKDRCWDSLMLACLLNSDQYRPLAYKLNLGDKDTFRLAFYLSGQSFESTSREPQEFGALYHTQKVPFSKHRFHLPYRHGEYRRIGLLQHDTDSEPLFEHRTVRPWCPYQDIPLNVRLPEGKTPLSETLQKWEEFDGEGLAVFQQRYQSHFVPSRKAWRRGALTKLGVKALYAFRALASLFPFSRTRPPQNG